ncbi:MAG TPA: hypothetical protein H9906_04270 [Candidatus Paenalcaligenes intestinipullorum]|uniref:DUF3329 domain-containing protein n=1 Tax=Candidatus Paenalcaligenes intestinipullorum TaxID=2838718 RepID=A0A9D2RFG9_9BURK|nr:hypothetical protein [Candidatus Paenalcaligenes intestinipullorum]
MWQAFLTRPIWRAFLLCIPLWFVLDNFVLAALAAILGTFLIGMLRELWRLRQAQSPTPPTDDSSTPS